MSPQAHNPPQMEDCIYKERLGDYDPYTSYEKIFIAENVGKDSLLDRMTHFDFKTRPTKDIFSSPFRIFSYKLMTIPHFICLH